MTDRGTLDPSAPAGAAAPVRRGKTRRLRYQRIGNLPHNVANNVVYAMQTSLAKRGLRYTLSPRNVPLANVARVLGKTAMIRAIWRPGRTAYLVPAGQGAASLFFPVTYFHEVVPWVFDAWPNLYDRIERTLRRQRVKLAFFTARQSADYFRERLGIETIWMPEACNPAFFDPSKPLAARSIDVLELGRKYDVWHDAVTARLAADGRKHLYEKVKGILIFATEADMRAGFNDAKVSMCFPSSLTHPARSGNVETVTLRYFESMAAKCLIVGRCPAELKDIMGYNPVVEVDLSTPQAAAEQIAGIVANIESYQPQVDRNYQAVLERGAWDVRIGELLNVLKARGYEPDVGGATPPPTSS